MKHLLLKTALFLLVAGGMTTIAPTDAWAAKYELKIASLAPKGSSWMKSFEKTNREIKKATNGEVALKIYGGGVMGDEGAMVRKMRTGQLDGAAVTNVGLGDIAADLLVLQLPLMFKNYRELDYVREKMSPTLEKILADKGFVLLHWGDVGFNYVFSNTPVHVPSDLRQTKFWVWDADPISKKVSEVAGVNGVLMGVPDVLPSLQTGVLDAFGNSPYGAVALQWHTKAKYVLNLKVAMVIGGLVVSKKSFDKIPAEHQAKILEISKKNGVDLLSQIRKDNQNAIKTIQGSDIQLTKPKEIKVWLKLASDVEKQLSGKLFPASLVKEMKGHLAAYRKK
jgi:TRAP-type C4-dicarboxylate transport system substrate-binding protein